MRRPEMLRRPGCEGRKLQFDAPPQIVFLCLHHNSLEMSVFRSDLNPHARRNRLFALQTSAGSRNLFQIHYLALPAIDQRHQMGTQITP